MRKILCYTIIFLVFISPLAYASKQQSIKLSLYEAILLAVRENPNVQTSQLEDVTQKFNLYIQEWEFYPHYSFQASGTVSRANSSNLPFVSTPNYNVQPGATWLTPIGTQATLSYTNQKTSFYNPGIALEIIQPLMRGFGAAIVESALNNARDTVDISRLNIEGTLRSAVTAVIDAYLDVMMAERTIMIDEAAVTRAEESVAQTKLFIKAGHKAGNELVTVEADVASAKTRLENDKNNLTQARYALLTAIGIDPNTPVIFSNLDPTGLIKKYPSLPLDVTKQLVLTHNIPYQMATITLHGPTKRALAVAEDNTRLQLNFTANMATGNGVGGGQNAGVNSLFNGANQSQSIGLVLQIPIDDQLSKQAVMNAKIALKEAEIGLLKTKWEIETGAINGWNNVMSARRALEFAIDAEQLQEKTYQVSYQKYLHGLIDSLELQSAQSQLTLAQQTLLSARVNYLKDLVNLDYLMGKTLTTWDVKVRE